jgi:hypothetical protein
MTSYNFATTLARIALKFLGMHRILFLPDIRLTNLVSGRIPDIKKTGLSARISGASLEIFVSEDFLAPSVTVLFMMSL